MRSPIDVAIVGAGMAGLAAARALAQRGMQACVLEATDRVGGRAMTLQHAGGELAIELGPEYVHGCPAPALELLRAAELRLEPVEQRHHALADGRLIEVGDMWARLGKLLAKVDVTAPDESARTFLARAPVTADDAQLIAMMIEGFYAAPLDDISITSIAADASEGAAQARVRGGYGRLVAYLAAELDRLGVEIRHRCFVNQISWSGDTVRLAIRGGDEIRAPRAIVTLPVGVLPDVQFAPGLGDHAAAFASLAMGPVVKLVVCLRSPVWWQHAPPDLEFVHHPSAALPTYWLRSAGSTHLVTAWAGGPHAQALAGRTTDELVELAIEGLSTALAMPRWRLAAAVRDVHFHDYQADPYARGAYSYTRVGGGHAAEILQRPLHDRLVFAGEATDPAYEGTVAGAIASGDRAAQQILALAG